jgi:hypothetical protein
MSLSYPKKTRQVLITQTKYTDYMTSGFRDARQLPLQVYPALA